MYQNTNRELRFVVTQGCNYACTFCHGEGMQTKQDNMMDASDYMFMYSVARKAFGLETATLSGGEPLVRNDIVEIARGLNEAGARTTITTNGALLERRLEIGKYIERANVSVHSLDKQKYEAIVQRPGTFEKTIKGIYVFKEKNPNVEVRLNAALVNGVNTRREDIREYIKFAEQAGASIKYLELYPKSAEGFFPLEEAEQILISEGFEREASKTRKHDFRRGNVKAGISRIFCSSAEESGDPSGYCHKNNDLFVNPNGRMKPCRASLDEVDFLAEAKARDEKGLAAKIYYAFELLGKGCVLAKELPSKAENKAAAA